MFRQALDTPFARADVRKIEKEEDDTVSKAADLSTLKDKRKWPEWDPAFVNYLSTIPGVSGVPLYYVVRDKEAPEIGAECGSFHKQAIACARQEGPPAYEEFFTD